MEKTNLQDFVCIMPFTYLAPFEDRIDACCGDWCDVRIPCDSIESAWTSKEMQDFRQNILDGNYSHCNEKCPFKADILRGNSSWLFVPKKDRSWNVINPPLKHIKFCSDETCNLHCKSCRDHKIVTNGTFLQRQLFELEMSDTLREHLERIDLLGSGDPFVSKPSRHWLFNFKPEDYPALKYIHIHSNGQLWTPEMNSKLDNVLPYIHSYEISIDASCKETYEKVRRGGSWDRLQVNLNTLIEVCKDACATFSFVVQKLNWQEIVLFYRYIATLKDFHKVSKDIVWSLRYSPAEKWKTTVEEYEDEINIRGNSEILKKVSEDLEALRNLREDIHIDSAL